MNLTIEKVDFTKEVLEDNYVDCHFIGCNFGQVDLSKIVFDGCNFNSCDFSVAKLDNSSFHDVLFTECKLMGADFTSANRFSRYNFKKCILHYASFRELKLSGISFEECDLMEADFSEAHLKGASFAGCNLDRTLFDSSYLQDVDFRTARLLVIDPNNNKVRGAQFSAENALGLLAHLNIKIEQ